MDIESFIAAKMAANVYEQTLNWIATGDIEFQDVLDDPTGMVDYVAYYVNHVHKLPEDEALQIADQVVAEYLHLASELAEYDAQGRSGYDADHEVHPPLTPLPDEWRRALPQPNDARNSSLPSDRSPEGYQEEASR